MPKGNDKEHYPFALEQEIKIIMDSFREFFPEELRDKTIVSFLWDTGVRIGEMLIIDASQIDLENKKAVIKTFKRNNHKREIYWTNETNLLLASWLEVRSQLIQKAKIRSNALFISMAPQSYGARAGKDVVQKLFRKKRQQLGIDRKITPHSLRHGFGARAVEKNVHPRHLQLMLGHAKLNTTMFYMGCENKETEKIYRNLMA
jgi:site-specific recombinase XerD